MSQTTLDPQRAPIGASVGAALRFVREHGAPLLVIAGVGAAATTALAMLELSVGQSAPLALTAVMADRLVSAAIYAALCGAALHAWGGAQPNLAGDTARVWMAMLVVSFFLLVMMAALLLPGAIVAASALAPYLPAMQAARGNADQTMAIAERIAQERPEIVAIMLVVYGAIWLMLTSRFYLAAPASVEARRVLTFETWRWTKNSMFRIIAARLMLLGPAWVLMLMLSALLGRALGVNILQTGAIEGFALHNPLGFGVFTLVSNFIAILCFTACEAGLSSALYRTLRPNAGSVS